MRGGGRDGGREREGERKKESEREKTKIDCFPHVSVAQAQKGEGENCCLQG
jgi:hypothetical protein